MRYARALFQLAQEQGCEEAVYSGLMRFAHNYLLAISQFNEVLANPIVAREEKVKLMEMSVGEPLHDTLKQFIAFVADQKRENICPWGFSRQEYWSGLPCPPPGDLPNLGIKPRSPALQVDSLPSEPPGKPKNTGVGSLSLLQQIFPTQESNQGLLHCK